ncbi:hypothetical protein DESC_370247 [Desulfosarcina cetonica]|nr:hypothetical protein DESC_370247 [Desulfosarcina cetonica]
MRCQPIFTRARRPQRCSVGIFGPWRVHGEPHLPKNDPVVLSGMLPGFHLADGLVAVTLFFDHRIGGGGGRRLLSDLPVDGRTQDDPTRCGFGIDLLPDFSEFVCADCLFCGDSGPGGRRTGRPGQKSRAFQFHHDPFYQ